MKHDREFEALLKTYEVLSELDSSARERVISYLQTKFEGAEPKPEKKERTSARVRSIPAKKTRKRRKRKVASADDGKLAELFNGLKIKGNAERVLLTAYHLNKNRKLTEFSARDVNRELKSIGKGIKNITLAFSKLTKSKLIRVSTEKVGARTRNTFRLSRTGTQAVNEALSSGVLAV
jgi:uncharacterized protein YyaL (SSP411 family)